MCYRPLARHFTIFFSLRARTDSWPCLMASFEDLPTEIAQKCVEFLESDEAIFEVKSVSRGLAATLLGDLRKFNPLMAPQLDSRARDSSSNWLDRDKARAFVAEAERILQVNPYDKNMPW